MRWLAAILSLLLPALAGAEEFTGKVIGVSDGDTITVLRDKRPVKIRLHGVDCPEKNQPFGQRAKKFTAQLVFGKYVDVDVVTKDRYGRTVGKVRYPARIHRAPRDRSKPHRMVTMLLSLQEELVKAGLAWWYRKYAPDDKQLAALEREAREAKWGLWADAAPIAPWDWRHGLRKPPPPPAEPGELDCKQDADCVLVTKSPTVCRCPPCPARAANRDYHERWSARLSRLRCRRAARCKPCKENTTGLRAVCVGSRCAMRGADPQRPTFRRGARPAWMKRPPTRAELRHPFLDYHGNVRSKVFHGPRCQHYRCKDCTAAFKTAAEASKAGYRPHEECVEGVAGKIATPPGPPKLPWSKERICKTDNDCVLRPIQSCSCGPCGSVWRTAVNREEHRALLQKWAKIRCKPPTCLACAGYYLGTRAICVKGQCQVK